METEHIWVDLSRATRYYTYSFEAVYAEIVFNVCINLYEGDELKLGIL